MEWQIALKRFSSTSFTVLTHEKALQPGSITSSWNASRVPDVGGGPSTSMFWAGNAGFTCFQVLYGLAIKVSGDEGSGTFLASARNRSLRDSLKFGAPFAFATTMPS